jgi:sucrose-6-phosphate hydrolase SacC (GH32 family)
VMRKLTVCIAAGILLLLITSGKPVINIYNELYRPQIHFSPEKGSLESLNGLVYSGGNFHLFYTCEQDTSGTGDPRYGHIVSADLLHWKQLAFQVPPGPKSESGNFALTSPGSILIDHQNLLGLQKGENKAWILFYTAQQRGQQLLWSTDEGISWNEYNGNPVIPWDESDEAVYPRIFRHEQTGRWMMALCRKSGSDERTKGFSFYSSSNLTDWEFKSHLAGFHGNPDLVELKVNNRADEKKWVVIEGDGNYVIGSFDGEQFQPESIRMRGDFGTGYNNPHSWGNISSSDGRIIQIAMLKHGTWPGMPFSGQLTFPCELSLKKINNGIFLFRQPVREIETMHDKKYSWTNENLIPGINKNLIRKVQGDCLHIQGRFDLKTCESFGFMLRSGKKNPGTELVYNVRRQILSILGKTIPVEPVDNKIFLNIIIDRASAEIFVNDGRIVVSNLFFSQESDRDYILFCTGGELMVEELLISTLKSVWETEK